MVHTAMANEIFFAVEVSIWKSTYDSTVMMNLPHVLQQAFCVIESS